MNIMTISSSRTVEDILLTNKSIAGHQNPAPFSWSFIGLFDHMYNTLFTLIMNSKYQNMLYYKDASIDQNKTLTRY